MAPLDSRIVCTQKYPAYRIALSLAMLIGSLCAFALGPSLALGETWVTAGGLSLSADDGGVLVAGTDYQYGVNVKYSNKYTTSNVVTILTDRAITIKNAVATTSTGINVPAGKTANITLAGVNITGNCVPININSGGGTNGGTLNLTIADNTTNTLSTAWHSPGIHCGQGATLRIDDSVPNFDINGQHIQNDARTTDPLDLGRIPNDTTYIDNTGTERTVDRDNRDGSKRYNRLTLLDSLHAGTLTVKGGPYSAGIGGGPRESGGHMTFDGGKLTVNANGTGDNAANGGAAIGGGGYGSGGNIIINGGEITAQASYHGAGIGAGWSNASCKDDANYMFTNSVQNVVTTVSGNIYINGGRTLSKGAAHGNGFGQACCGTASGCEIVITGGTLLPSSVSGRYDIGGSGGRVYVLGGSVKVSSGKYQSVLGSTTAYGDMGQNSQVMMTTIKMGGYTTTDGTYIARDAYIEIADLKINGVPVGYGLPHSTDSEGNLYLWLPKTTTGEVQVDLNVISTKDGTIIDTLPFFINEIENDAKKVLKQYSEFTIYAVDGKDDYNNEYTGLGNLFPINKRYDGKPYAWLSSATIPSETTLAQAIAGVTPDDGEGQKPAVQQPPSGDTSNPNRINTWQDLSFLYQEVDEEGYAYSSGQFEGTPIYAGVNQLIVTSKQYTGKSQYQDFSESFWGHRAYFNSITISPADTMTDIEGAYITGSGEVPFTVDEDGNIITSSASGSPLDGANPIKLTANVRPYRAYADQNVTSYDADKTTADILKFTSGSYVGKTVMQTMVQPEDYQQKNSEGKVTKIISREEYEKLSATDKASYSPAIENRYVSTDGYGTVISSLTYDTLSAANKANYMPMPYGVFTNGNDVVIAATQDEFASYEADTTYTRVTHGSEAPSVAAPTGKVMFYAIDAAQDTSTEGFDITTAGVYLGEATLAQVSVGADEDGRGGIIVNDKQNYPYASASITYDFSDPSNIVKFGGSIPSTIKIYAHYVGHDDPAHKTEERINFNSSNAWFPTVGVKLNTGGTDPYSKHIELQVLENDTYVPSKIINTSTGATDLYVGGRLAVQQSDGELQLLVDKNGKPVGTYTFELVQRSSNGSDGNPTYEPIGSSDILDIDANTGLVTPKKKGTAFVRITRANDGVYAAISTVATINVYEGRIEVYSQYASSSTTTGEGTETTTTTTFEHVDYKKAIVGSPITDTLNNKAYDTPDGSADTNTQSAQAWAQSKLDAAVAAGTAEQPMMLVGWRPANESNTGPDTSKPLYSVNDLIEGILATDGQETDKVTKVWAVYAPGRVNAHKEAAYTTTVVRTIDGVEKDCPVVNEPINFTVSATDLLQKISYNVTNTREVDKNVDAVLLTTTSTWAPTYESYAGTPTEEEKATTYNTFVREVNNPADDASKWEVVTDSSYTALPLFKNEGTEEAPVWKKLHVGSDEYLNSGQTTIVVPLTQQVTYSPIYEKMENAPTNEQQNAVAEYLATCDYTSASTTYQEVASASIPKYKIETVASNEDSTDSSNSEDPTNDTNNEEPAQPNAEDDGTTTTYYQVKTGSYVIDGTGDARTAVLVTKKDDGTYEAEYEEITEEAYKELNETERDTQVTDKIVEEVTAPESITNVVQLISTDIVPSNYKLYKQSEDVWYKAKTDTISVKVQEEYQETKTKDVGDWDTLTVKDTIPDGYTYNNDAKLVLTDNGKSYTVTALDAASSNNVISLSVNKTVLEAQLGTLTTNLTAKLSFSATPGIEVAEKTARNDATVELTKDGVPAIAGASDEVTVGPVVDDGARSIVKKATNETTAYNTHVGDTIRYDMSITNFKRYTWFGAIMYDKIPTTLDVSFTAASPITVTDANGTTYALYYDADYTSGGGGAATGTWVAKQGENTTPLTVAPYNEETREICVLVGDLGIGGSAKVTFKATVNMGAMSGSFANTAYAHGGTSQSAGHNPDGTLPIGSGVDLTSKGGIAGLSGKVMSQAVLPYESDGGGAHPSNATMILVRERGTEHAIRRTYTDTTMLTNKLGTPIIDVLGYNAANLGLNADGYTATTAVSSAYGWASSTADQGGYRRADRVFLGWTRDYNTNVLLTVNDLLGEGTTTVYPVYGTMSTQPGPQPGPDPVPDPDPGESSWITKGVANMTEGHGLVEVSGAKDDNNIDIPDYKDDNDQTKTAPIVLDVLHYTINVDNVDKIVSANASAGGADWSKIVFTDKIPEHAQFLGTQTVTVHTGTGESATDITSTKSFNQTSTSDPGTLTISINRSSLLESKSFVVEFDVKIARSAKGKFIDNQASIIFNTDDGSTVGGGTSNIVRVGIVADPGDYGITKTAVNKTAQEEGRTYTKANDLIDYTITATNGKRYTWFDAVIYDQVPKIVDVDFDSVKVTYWDYDTSNVLVKKTKLGTEAGGKNAKQEEEKKYGEYLFNGNGYNELFVSIGHVPAGESATLSFTGRATASGLVIDGKNVSLKNVAYASGEAEDTWNPNNGQVPGAWCIFDPTPLLQYAPEGTEQDDLLPFEHSERFYDNFVRATAVPFEYDDGEETGPVKPDANYLLVMDRNYTNAVGRYYTDSTNPVYDAGRLDDLVGRGINETAGTTEDTGNQPGTNAFDPMNDTGYDWAQLTTWRAEVSGVNTAVGPRPSEEHWFVGWTDNPRVWWNPYGTDRIIGDDETIPAGVKRIYPVYARKTTNVDKTVRIVGKDGGEAKQATYGKDGDYVLDVHGNRLPLLGTRLHYEIKASVTDLGPEEIDTYSFVDKIPQNTSLVENSVHLTYVQNGETVTKTLTKSEKDAGGAYVYDADHYVYIQEDDEVTNNGALDEISYQCPATADALPTISFDVIINTEKATLETYINNTATVQTRKGDDLVTSGRDDGNIGPVKDPGSRDIIKVAYNESAHDPQISGVGGRRYTRIGDKIHYTLTAHNYMWYDTWNNVVIYDKIPESLTIDTTSIKLRDWEGNEYKVPASAYNVATRELCVFAGSVPAANTYYKTIPPTINLTEKQYRNSYNNKVQLEFDATVNDHMAVERQQSTDTLWNRAQALDGVDTGICAAGTDTPGVPADPKLIDVNAGQDEEGNPITKRNTIEEQYKTPYSPTYDYVESAAVLPFIGEDEGVEGEEAILLVCWREESPSQIDSIDKDRNGSTERVGVPHLGYLMPNAILYEPIINRLKVVASVKGYESLREYYPGAAKQVGAEAALGVLAESAEQSVGVSSEAIAGESGETWGKKLRSANGPMPDDDDTYFYIWRGWTDDPRTSWNPTGTDRILGENDLILPGENRVYPVYARVKMPREQRTDDPYDPPLLEMEKGLVSRVEKVTLYQELEYKVAAHNMANSKSSWANVTFMDKFPSYAKLVPDSVYLKVVDYSGITQEQKQNGVDGKILLEYKLSPSADPRIGTFESGKYNYDEERSMVSYRIMSDWLPDHPIHIEENQSVELRFKIYITRDYFETKVDKTEPKNEGSVTWYPPVPDDSPQPEDYLPLWTDTDWAPLPVPDGDPGSRGTTKKAENLTRGDAAARIGDRIKYTITATNGKAYDWEGVRILDVLPEGLTIDTSTIRIVGTDGKEHTVDPKAYVEETRKLCVAAGTIGANEEVVLTFEAVINDNAAKKDADIGNVASVGGYDPWECVDPPSIGDPTEWPEDWKPDGDGTGTGTGVGTGIGTIICYPPGTDKGPIPYPEPDPELGKRLKNVTEPNDPDIMKKEVQIESGVEYKEVLRYTVTLHNPTPGPAWEDMEIFDFLPDELVYLNGTLKLTKPNGTVETLPDKYFNEAEHIFEVPIGKIAYGETYTLEYRVGVPEDLPKEKPLVNKATANVPEEALKKPWLRLAHTGDALIAPVAIVLAAGAVLVLGLVLRRRHKE